MDTPIEPVKSSFSFSAKDVNLSNRDRGGSALAVDSSNRNNDVYKQLTTERNRNLPARKATPFDDMETEHSGDDEAEMEERRRREEQVYARFR